MLALPRVCKPFLTHTCCNYFAVFVMLYLQPRSSRGMEALEVVLPVTAALSQLHSACHPVLQPAMAGSWQRPSQNAAQASGGQWTGHMLLPPLSWRQLRERDCLRR